VWHIHHDKLVEWTDDLDERIEYVKGNKAPAEVETRLRLMKPVQGQLPEVFVKASAERKRAYAEWDRMDAERDQASAERKRAYAEWDRASAEWDRAWVECLPQIEALHAIECPGCPWDGKTIFPQVEQGET
jgi:peptidoglycan hydrolase CwlO-like protein